MKKLLLLVLLTYQIGYGQEFKRSFIICDSVYNEKTEKEYFEKSSFDDYGKNLYIKIGNKKEFIFIKDKWKETDEFLYFYNKNNEFFAVVKNEEMFIFKEKMFFSCLIKNY